MRKSLCLTVLLVLLFSTACSDLSSGGAASDEPVEIIAVERGEIIQPGQNLEYSVTLTDKNLVPDRLELSVTDESGSIIYSDTKEESPLEDFTDLLQFSPETVPGRYVLRFDFYKADELLFSDSREFFITPDKCTINSINSYPPVLYPGAGGLLYADIECSGSGCWLRWTLDGEVIAEGTEVDGYRSIEIEAPESEGAYNLSLEIFPFAPSENGNYDFESPEKKEVPLYINREHKTALNEFSPENSFRDLYHFRGNFINSASGVPADGRELVPVGMPELAVYDGIFGYYFESGESLHLDSLMMPVSDSSLDDFTVMTSFIPYYSPGVEAASGEYQELFYTGTQDGYLYLSMGINNRGELYSAVKIGDNYYDLFSEGQLLMDGQYCTLGFAVSSDEDKSLKLVWNLNGQPIAEKVIVNDGGDTAPWKNIKSTESEAETRILGGDKIAALMDEFGIYSDSVDPQQYSKAMTLKYGKFLMYAEGFDGADQSLPDDSPKAYVADSSLFIEPGSAVDFPVIYPGYEEVVFTIGTGETPADNASVAFYLNGSNDMPELLKLRLENIPGEEEVTFSLIFTDDSVVLDRAGYSDIGASLAEDFNGIAYRLVNDDAEKTLEIKRILIIRKNLDISINEVNIPAGKNIRS